MGAHRKFFQENNQPEGSGTLKRSPNKVVYRKYY